MLRRALLPTGRTAVSVHASPAVNISSARPFSLSPFTYTSTPAASVESNNDFIKEVREQFWRPVNVQAENSTGDDVARYRMMEHVRRMIDGSNIPPPRYMWAGAATNDPQIVEDFLWFFTTGFDIKKVDVADEDKCEFIVEHRRNFLGWKPSSEQLPDTSSPSSVPASCAKIVIPFDMEITANPSPRNSYQTVRFTWDLAEALKKATSGPPPQEVLDCVQDPAVIRMVAALRKSGVRPEIISWRALQSATKKTSTWASALGVM